MTGGETKQVRLAMSNEELIEASKGVFSALNSEIQLKKFTSHQVLMAALYAIGASMQQAGIRVLPNEVVATALPSLMEGYRNSALMRKKK